VKQRVVASELLLEAVRRHDIHLSVLVADTGLWTNPEFHQRLVRDTGSVAMFPKVRRARIGQGEQRGQIVDGIRFDDNSYANVAIKRAVGLGKSAEGFEACHIWPLTCYDERFHTAPANIVLLPRALAGLSDHDVEIQKALQYRSFELYGWWPTGLDEPLRPEFYPASWREPLPDVTPRAKRVSRGPSQSESSGALPLTFEPASPEAFKTQLLATRRARIEVTFVDDSVEVWPWNANRFSQSSNVVGNLRSRPEFRQGEWQKLGIVGVHVRVLGGAG